jgi:rare lipoprotein A
LAVKIRVYFSLSIFLFLINHAEAQHNFTQKGMASYYGAKFQGRKTACGEIFDMNEYTAAHPKLPFHTLVKVTNLSNNKSVVVRINDRGPFTKKRIIDLSKAAASKIDLIRAGTTKVKIEVLESDKPGSDEEKEGSAYAEDTRDPVYSEINDLKAGKIYNDKGEVKEPSGYGIQVASLSKPANVIETIQKINKEGIKDVYIQVLMVDDKKIYRIIAGDHSHIDSAEKDLERLELAGFKGFVKKYRF